MTVFQLITSISRHSAHISPSSLKCPSSSVERCVKISIHLRTTTMRFSTMHFARLDCSSCNKTWTRAA
ncbi:hypothetical protein IEO21_04303 [Rhodonia placenta]|uniref:Uncharacterized protein n=1 Tax=Rhodonia placenta TaxID=104341 RepID=A0A8H7P4F5_9APHY|nr:hypothetical protein IEO21_04303 [Postia placenta]